MFRLLLSILGLMFVAGLVYAFYVQSMDVFEGSGLESTLESVVETNISEYTNYKEQVKGWFDWFAVLVLLSPILLLAVFIAFGVEFVSRKY